MRSAHPAARPSHLSRPAAAALALAAVGVLAAVLTAACGGTAASPARSAGSAASQPVATPSAASSSPAPPGTLAPVPAASPSRSPATVPAVIAVPQPPARLHQTRAFPSARTSVFRAEMTDLWAAVVTGRPAPGMAAFFPLSAYRQVKAIADPAADWHDRLVYDFRLDVRAAHALLGRGARRDVLVRVIVPSAQAAWIVPGVCYNGVGYWHVAGARLLYRAGRQLRSFGIASLISWRGRWYVVHFGAVLRSSAAGIVDQPAIGPGVPGPPGGC